MRRLHLLLFMLVSLGTMYAHKPADTLSAGRWEFVQNLGQWNSAVVFSARMNGGALFFENNSYVVAQLHPRQLQDLHEAKHSGKPFPQHFIDAAAYRVSFLNANPKTAVVGEKPYDHYYNYFLGKDPTHWASYVLAYNTLSYNQLYDKINLFFLADNDYLKYEFHIAPGGDPKQIRMQYDGLENITKVGEELLLHTAVDRILELQPFAYQIDKKGDTISISCKYHLQKNILSFDIGDYDPSLPLVIDPTVIFSSFSGSIADNWGYTATYDSHGNLYGGGIVFGIGYPITLGYFESNDCDNIDVSILKFDASGSFLHYTTYLGGSATDIPHSLHVNDNDELYIFGTTGSSNFPVTNNAYDTTFNGGFPVNVPARSFANGSDIFIAKLSADGAQLPASTFIGGSDNDGINTAAILKKNYADEHRGEIIVDENSNVYVVTSTLSSDFPTTGNCYHSNSSGGQEVCVFKLSQDLSTLIWSTYFGGSDNDAGYSMYVAADRSVYFCGGTTSADLPTTPNVFQTTHADNEPNSDGFVAHLSSNGNLLLHSTYLGKSGYDQAYLIKGDDEDFPHIFGQTDADNLQWVQNANYYVPGGGQFLIKLSKNLSSAIWSTAIGTGNGGPDISPTAMLVDYCDNIYLSGWGGQLNRFGGTNGLPITSDAYQTTTDDNDFYFMAISDDASNLIYATYFGGSENSAREHVDGGTSRFDKHGKIYQAVCAGCGGQSSFPTTDNAYATQNGSSNCNLGVIKIDFSLPVVVADFLTPNIVCLPDTAFFTNYSRTISSSTAILWDFGDGSTSTEWEPYHIYTNPGFYHITLIIQDLGSCNVADTLRKRILVLANTQSTLPTISICEGDFAELGIPPSIGVDYLWSPAETLSNPSISNPIATPLESTLYTLIASTAACVDTLKQQVDVHKLDVTFVGDTLICYGDNATLDLQINATDPYLIEWSESIDFQNIISSGSNPFMVIPSSSQYYYARVTSNYCTRIIPVFVKVNHLVLVNIQDFLLCFEDSIVLESPCVGGVEPYQYTWSLGDGETSSYSNPVFTPQHTTNYTVTVTDVLGCTTSASGLIKVRENTFPETLQAWCSPDEILAYHKVTLFSTDYGSDYSYSWTPSTIVETPHLPSTTAIPTETITFTITVTDTFGCSLSDTVTVKVNPVSCDMPFVFIPNSFTPNGDGVNDILFVRSDILMECYFVIYNRWGEKVFETHDQTIGWDGTFKKKECQTGTYDYYFKGKCMDGDELELKGNVTLLR